MKKQFKTQSHLPSSKRIKYLGINLPKERGDLYSDSDGWKEIYHVHGLEESVSCNWLYYQRQSTDCNPHQVTNGIFHRTRTKICMETQKTPNSQSNLEKEKWSWRNQAPWLQTILQSYTNQNSMIWAQKQNIHQWNRIECPKINPHTYSNIIYSKGSRNIQWRKESPFN